MNVFSERLESLRNGTQKEFARFLGVPLTSYTNWVANTSSPKAEYIIQVCSKLGVSADYLLGLSDNPNDGASGGGTWQSRALVAEQKLARVNRALGHALKGFEELQEAVK